MKHLIENKTFFNKFSLFLKSQIPSGKDNLFQAGLKISFILILIFSIIFTTIFLEYFLHGIFQRKIISETQEIWNSAEVNNDVEIYNTFKKQNPDFKGWLKVGTGVISQPVFQTNNNDFYKNHNLKGKQSRYGALFFDKVNNLNSIEENFNLIIYGNSLPDNSMFTRLEDYRELDFFKQHNTIMLSFPKENVTYKVISAFVYGKNKSFDIFTQHVDSEKEFEIWTEKIKGLSFINTDIDLEFGDTFLTLVSDSNDFEGAKNVVVARKIRAFETTYTATNQFKVNPNRQLPIK